ncbi:transaldolase family protein [Streptomyces sp. NPDC048441]|uniref:transaldolase family protein n=1 Tax=Streptomyces sp. NPDC048441 TaxID=3365552 RepID=UPI003716C5EE
MADRFELPAKVALRGLDHEGVSVWVHGAEQLGAGRLARLIRYVGARGAVLDPTALAGAVRDGGVHRELLAGLARRGATANAAVRGILVDEARRGCDALLGVYEARRGQDGFVSVPVPGDVLTGVATPAAHLKVLWTEVGRPNLLLRLPACENGLDVARACLAHGIGVHIDQVGSASQYAQVLRVCAEGLELARQSGVPLGMVASVAAMDLAAVDAEVERELTALGASGAVARRQRGRVAVAQARLAFRVHDEWHGGASWSALRAAGALPQRLMWTVSGTPVPVGIPTGTGKPPPDVAGPSGDLGAAGPRSPVSYVERLVGWNTVVAMTAPDLAALGKARLRGDGLLGAHTEAERVMTELADLGVRYGVLARRLASRQLTRLLFSWRELHTAVATHLDPGDRARRRH